MVDGPIISAVTTHKIEKPDPNLSTCEFPFLRVSHQNNTSKVLEFGSDAWPLGCICGPSRFYKRQKITSTVEYHTGTRVLYSSTRVRHIAIEDTKVAYQQNIRENWWVTKSRVRSRYAGPLYCKLGPVWWVKRGAQEGKFCPLPANSNEMAPLEMRQCLSIVCCRLHHLSEAVIQCGIIGKLKGKPNSIKYL